MMRRIIAKTRIFFLFLLIFFYISISKIDGLEDPSFAKMRKEMVVYQIEARGIRDNAVLAAMRKVPRQEFVPKDLQPFAYADRPLPIGEGQTISQPYIVALMTSLLDLKGDERVLEIGTGSGYQAAILAEVVKEVYSIEIKPNLAKSAENKLKELDYTNVKVKTGNGYLGWDEYAPFDAIIITCAPNEIPELLVEQLKDGGIMVLPLTVGYSQKLFRIYKRGRGIRREYITDVLFVPMIHEEE